MFAESEFDAMVMHKNCYDGYFFTSIILLIFWNYELRFLAKTQKKRIFSHLHCYLCYGEVITLSQAAEDMGKRLARRSPPCSVR